MWNCVEFVKLQFIVGANVNVSSLVFRTIAILWRRKNYWKLEIDSLEKMFSNYLLYIGHGAPLHTLPSALHDF